MPRVSHGGIKTTTDVRRARTDLAAQSLAVELGFVAAAPVDLQDFDFLVPQPTGGLGQHVARVTRHTQEPQAAG